MGRRQLCIVCAVLAIAVGARALSSFAATKPTTETGPNESEQTTDKPAFNAQLAKELGADDYGMRSYVFCTLVTGKTKIEDPAKSKQIFAGHFSNMGRLAKAGKLVLAGPFVDGAPKRGLYIFDVTTIEEAEALVKTDPAVQAGVFDFELTKLYCSAALKKVGQIHETIQKTPIE